MATIEQIKSLMRSHFENDNEKFKTIALQIAAHEAKVGHTSSARDIRDIVQNPKYSTKSKIVKLNNRNEMLEERISDFELRDLVVTESISEKIKRIIKKLEEMKKNGYAIDNEEYVEGLKCVAAPIFDHNGKVRFSLSTTGPAFRMDEERIKELIVIIKEAANEISHRIGYMK
jgi:hypothetical protein